MLYTTCSLVPYASILYTQVTQALQSSLFDKYVYHQYGFIIHQLISMHTKEKTCN